MKTKILSGLICCLGIFSANAQTITAPLGQPLTITNSVDVTLPTGNVNVPADGSFNFGGKIILSTKGTGNVLLGESAGGSNTGTNNVFVGTLAGFTNTTGSNNIHFGSNAGRFSTGSANTFIGGFAGYANTGTDNLFLGSAAGFNNTTGSNNICIGSNAGRLSNGLSNTFVGYLAGFNTTGNNNLFMGDASGVDNLAGSGNVFLGPSAGRYHASGDNNTYVGNNARGTVPGLITNATSIGANALASTSNTVVLGQAATTITGQGLASGSGLRFPNLTSGSAVTSVPGGRVLSVDGSGNVVLVQLSTTPGATLSVGQPVSDNWKEADGYLYNNSTNGVVIKGTGLDGNSLIVKGGVLSKEVNVKVEGSESWPDYVFQPSYKRMSLDEVEKFITVNKHLPNVPSAAEMAITGNNLGKTDVKLLEKVEELTLYLLEMKKTNDAQSAELQSLKNQMNKLKKNRK
jgi:trimeric autotransporter adhesin